MLFFPQFPVGYRHMCRWYAGLIFQHEALQGYDYVWRLDTDSFILAPIEHDPFEVLTCNDYVYGYLMQQDHPPGMCGDIDAHVNSYIKEHQLGVSYRWDRVVPYNNFEIMDIGFFGGKDYQSLFRHLDATYGFYRYRWGDYIPRIIGLHLFAAGKFVKLKDIRYRHQGATC